MNIRSCIRLDLRQTWLTVVFVLSLIAIVSCAETGALAKPTATSTNASSPTERPEATALATKLTVPTELAPTAPSSTRANAPDALPTSTPAVTATIAPTTPPLVVAPSTTPTPIPVPLATVETSSIEPTSTVRVGTPIPVETVAPSPTTALDPPPYHYTTQAAAEAGSIELGCTGWGRVPVGLIIYYRACASADLFADLISNSEAGSNSDTNTATPSPTVGSTSSTVPTPTPVELPPFHYLTDAEALAKADELGCIGTSGGVFEGVSFRRACGSERDFQVIALKVPTTLSGEICTLESDPTARFTTAPTDLSKIGSVVPPGSALSGTIKPHAYFHNKFVNDNSGKVRVPVYAVADSVLSSVVYYDSFLGIAEYLLFFDVTCEISFKYDHIAEVIPEIAALVPEVSPDSSGGISGGGMSFKAGDLIGYAYGAGGSAAGGGGAWDFGAYDTTFVNQFVNQERYVQGGMSQSLHTVCPYDYFGEDLKNQMYALIGTSSQAVIPNAICTTTERDVSGAAAGAWFEELEISYRGANFSIATEPDSRVSLSGIGGDLRPTTDHPTWFDPELLTTSHCYADSARWIYLEVRAEGMQLAAANGTGSCPSAMPMEVTIYYR